MLENIVEHKRQEILNLNKTLSRDKIAPRPRDAVFRSAVTRADDGTVKLIAEVKRASPAKGQLTNREPEVLTEAYVTGGAAALSVLTDRKFFHGDPGYLTRVRGYGRPLLRKDFILEPVQIYESCQLQADAVLLIAAILDYELLLTLVNLSLEWGLEPLVEVHDREELARALDTPARVIGINNRNLRDFTVDFKTSLDLGPLIPADRIRISMSGISSPGDLMTLEEAGFDAALVGEVLSTAPDIAARTHELADYRRYLP